MKLLPLAFVFAVVGLTACGGGSSDSPSVSVSNISEADVVNALDGKLKRSFGGYDSGDGRCAVTGILTDEGDVNGYKYFGNAVAKNEDGTVGIGTRSTDPTTSDQDCVDYFTPALEANF